MTTPPKRSLFTIAHLTLTLGLLAFLFAQYERYRDFSAHVDAELATLAAKVQAEAETERVRHAATDAQMSDLRDRIEVHRSDIRALQAQVNSHVDAERKR